MKQDATTLFVKNWSVGVEKLGKKSEPQEDVCHDERKKNRVVLTSLSEIKRFFRFKWKLRPIRRGKL